MGIKEWLGNYDLPNIPEMYIAFNHPSLKSVNPNIMDYETYETVGDAVIDLLILQIILNKYPYASPGFLTEKRSLLVNNKILKKLGDVVGIKNLIKTSPHYNITDNDIASVVEAIFGALYLTRGIMECQKLLNLLWEPYIPMIADEKLKYNNNPIGHLQEIMQKKHADIPKYEIVYNTGPPHDPTFIISVRINIDGNKIETLGVGKSKHEAKENASLNMINILLKNNLIQAK